MCVCVVFNLRPLNLHISSIVTDHTLSGVSSLSQRLAVKIPSSPAYFLSFKGVKMIFEVGFVLICKYLAGLQAQ